MKTSVDAAYLYLAAKYVRKQAKQLADQLEGIRKAEDIEFVHRARVASRRLRAALRMFRDCFHAGRLRRWRKGLRRVAAGLGDARDKDVQVAFLRDTLHAFQGNECPSGIMRLLVKCEQDRESLQSQVIKAIDHLQDSGVLDEMQDVTKRVLFRARKRDLRPQSPVSFDQTEQHIVRQLEALLPYQESLLDPEDQASHHAMRIAAKRLRYTLEISKPVYDDRLDEFIESVKNLQTLLGEIHDCDVWREQLQAFSEKLRRRILKHFGHVAPLGRLQSGIAYLDDDRRRRRAVVFDELAAYWRQLAEKRFWERLAAIVMARPQEPRQPRPQAAAGDGQPALTPAAGGRPRECQTPGADETVDDLDQVDHGRQAERRGGGPPAAPPRLELQEALSH